MSDLPRRLRASLKFDAINGDRSERKVCGLQMAEAARTIEDLEARLAAAEADARRLDWLDTKNAPFKMGWECGMAPARLFSLVER